MLPPLEPDFGGYLIPVDGQEPVSGASTIVSLAHMGRRTEKVVPMGINVPSMTEPLCVRREGRIQHSVAY